jgi:putative hemolysin
VDGALNVRDLESQYGVALPEDSSYETVGGFVLSRLGFIPRGGESFEASGYRFTVMEMERRRISRVKIKPIPVPPPPSPSPGETLLAGGSNEPSTEAVETGHSEEKAAVARAGRSSSRGGRGRSSRGQRTDQRSKPADEDDRRPA